MMDHADPFPFLDSPDDSFGTFIAQRWTTSMGAAKAALMVHSDFGVTCFPGYRRIVMAASRRTIF